MNRLSTARHARMSSSRALSGTTALLTAMLRFSRRSIIWWTLGCAGFLFYIIRAMNVVFADPQALQARASLMGMPAGAMLSGPGYGIENYTLPVMMANELLGAFAVAIAIMGLRLAIRHTRADEESGRADLLRSLPVARLAPLSAAVIVVLIAVTLVSSAMFVMLLIAGFQVLGSLLFAAGLLGVGAVFGAVGVLCAQLSASTRTASSLAGALLGLAYLMRAVGDASQRGGSTLSWLSPIGWAQQTRAYVDDTGWPLLLFVALFTVLTAAAYLLQMRREVDAGLLPQRKGRGSAGIWLRGVGGLYLRLDRGRIIGWGISVFAGAAMIGTLAQPMANAFRDIPALQSLLKAQPDAAVDHLVLAAMGMFLALLGMVGGIYAVQSTHHLRLDEAGGRTALMLCGPVSRMRIIVEHLLVSFFGCAVMALLAGLGLGLGAQGGVSQPIVGTCILASLAYLPITACWLALSTLSYGIGRGGLAPWLLLVACMVIGIYGALLNIPQQLMDLEPYTSLNALGIVQDGASAIALFWYSLAAVVLCALAMAAFRRRDLHD